MSYNRDIRDGVGRIEEDMKLLSSSIGKLSEIILQHSDFLRRANEAEEKEREKATEIEKAKNKAKDEFKNKEIELDAKRTELERQKQDAENIRNAREAELYGSYLKNKEDSILREEELLRREKEIAEAETEQKKAELRAKYAAIDEEEALRKKFADAQNKNISLLSEIGDTLRNQVAKLPEQIISTVLSMQTSAVEKVSSVYQQHAGKLSAMLDSSVSDISQMQNSIAKQLRETGLNGAISNVQVLEEASRMASSGYTNEAKLEQSATDIAIARQIAPSVDMDNASVKNLINVFGSDFTHKFAGIASAVQDSAGSLAAVQSVLGSLMTDLEPVYLNAELQAAALQGTSDVTATLSAAQEQGLLSEANVAQYKSMLVELMDPSKALTSNNVAVRTAAANLYQSGNYNGDPSQALEALLGANQSIMGNFGQSNSTQDMVFRSFGAGAFGLDTMTATYNPDAYTDVNMVRTGDIGQSYNEQLGKLEDGAYTTQQTEEENKFANSSVTQSISNFAKEFPQTYKLTSAAIIAAINTAGSGLTSRISSFLTNGKIGGGGGPGAAGEEADTGINTLSQLSKATAVNGHEFIGSKGLGFISSNSAKGLGSGALKTLTGANLSGLGAAAVGIGGAVSLGTSLAYAFDEDNKDQTAAQKLSYGGNIGEAMMSGAGVGATAGMALGTIIPGIGNAFGAAIGGFVGAAGGLVTALVAQKDTAEQQKEAMEAQTQATRDLLGDGIKPLTEVEKASATQNGRATMAIGNDTFALSDFGASDYAAVMSSNAGGLDFVPYDNYIARLHKGEAVVTAKAAEDYRQSNPQFYRDSKEGNRQVVDKLDEQTNKIVSALTDDEKLKPLDSGSMFTQTYVIANQNA